MVVGLVLLGTVVQAQQPVPVDCGWVLWGKDMNVPGKYSKQQDWAARTWRPWYAFNTLPECMTYMQHAYDVTKELLIKSQLPGRMIPARSYTYNNTTEYAMELNEKTEHTKLQCWPASIRPQD
jgi:hypothetical protein